MNEKIVGIVHRMHENVVEIEHLNLGNLVEVVHRMHENVVYVVTEK